ncbi:MAG: hypothetical protein LUH63_03870 [Parabacteroides sp.]|nr:hypothetical protein [Parabacteroides sp.]
MRLRQYTLRNLSVPLLLILSAWACAFYITIIREINEETDESLTNHKMLIIKAALADSTLLTDHVDILTQYYIREISRQKQTCQGMCFSTLHGSFPLK